MPIRNAGFRKTLSREQRQPTPAKRRELMFALGRFAASFKSNACLMRATPDRRGGAGKFAVRLVQDLAMKAVLPLKGTVAASDPFSPPFPDGVEEMARHGATAIIQPRLRSGSGRIETADRLGLAMCLLEQAFPTLICEDTL